MPQHHTGTQPATRARKQNCEQNARDHHSSHLNPRGTPGQNRKKERKAKHGNPAPGGACLLWGAAVVCVRASVDQANLSHVHLRAQRPRCIMCCCMYFSVLQHCVYVSSLRSRTVTSVSWAHAALRSTYGMPCAWVWLELRGGPSLLGLYQLPPGFIRRMHTFCALCCAACAGTLIYSNTPYVTFCSRA